MKRSAAQMAYPDSYNAAKRRRFLNRASRNSGAGLTAAQIAQVDREIVRVTRNRADKNATNFFLAATACTNAVLCEDVAVNLVHGDGSLDNFQGEGIIPQGLTVRYNFSQVATTTPLEQVRVLVVQYYGPGTLANAGGANYILNNVGGSRAALSVKDWVNRKQFKILRDSDAIQLQDGTIGGGGNGGGCMWKVLHPSKGNEKDLLR